MANATSGGERSSANSLADTYLTKVRRCGYFATALLTLVTLSGCATSTALRNGQKAEQLQEYDRAILEYTKVLREHPENREARQLLERAKLRSSLDHFARGRRFHNGGRLDEAVVELQLGAELNPANQEIEEELATVRTELRNKIAVSRDGKTGLESLIDRTRNLAPIGYELPSDVRMIGSPDVGT